MLIKIHITRDSLPQRKEKLVFPCPCHPICYFLHTSCSHNSLCERAGCLYRKRPIYFMHHGSSSLIFMKSWSRATFWGQFIVLGKCQRRGIVKKKYFHLNQQFPHSKLGPKCGVLSIKHSLHHYRKKVNMCSLAHSIPIQVNPHTHTYLVTIVACPPALPVFKKKKKE